MEDPEKYSRSNESPQEEWPSITETAGGGKKGKMKEKRMLKTLPIITAA